MHKTQKWFYIKLVSIPVLMFGFAFALIPLYTVLCDITGLNGRSSNLSEVAQQSEFKISENRQVNVHFLANVASGMPIVFYPKESNIELKPGEITTVYYIAENRSDKTIFGQAIPSVAPEGAAAHLKKLECFCFNKQIFAPNDRVEMPVQIVVDSDLDQSIVELTLSYTFYRLEDEILDQPINKSVIKTHGLNS